MAKKKNDGSDEFVNFFAYGVAGIITVFMWMVRIILFIPYLIIKFTNSNNSHLFSHRGVHDSLGWTST